MRSFSSVTLSPRSETQSTFTLGLRSNWWLAGAVALSLVAQLAVVYLPALQLAFQTEALSAVQLAVVAVVSTGVRRRGYREVVASAPNERRAGTFGPITYGCKRRT